MKFQPYHAVAGRVTHPKYTATLGGRKMPDQPGDTSRIKLSVPNFEMISNVSCTSFQVVV